VSARIRAGSRLKRFLCSVLIGVKYFRVPTLKTTDLIVTAHLSLAFLVLEVGVYVLFVDVFMDH
jgi:hypothetical protein